MLDEKMKVIKCLKCKRIILDDEFYKFGYIVLTTSGQADIECKCGFQFTIDFDISDMRVREEDIEKAQALLSHDKQLEKMKAR